MSTPNMYFQGCGDLLMTSHVQVLRLYGCRARTRSRGGDGGFSHGRGSFAPPTGVEVQRRRSTSGRGTEGAPGNRCRWCGSIGARAARLRASVPRPRGRRGRRDARAGQRAGSGATGRSGRPVRATPCKSGKTRIPAANTGAGGSTRVEIPAATRRRRRCRRRR